jgi:hypothetical protein
MALVVATASAPGPALPPPRSPPPLRSFFEKTPHQQQHPFLLFFFVFSIYHVYMPMPVYDTFLSLDPGSYNSPRVLSLCEVFC